MPFGYTGRVLRVDLTTLTLETWEPSESWYRTYWGGGAMASYFLLREMPAGADPYGPDNLLVFAAGVVCGAPLSGFSRYTVAGRSPLTGGFGEAEAGGYFGPEMKFAGFDCVVIRGVAPKPVYLWLHDGQAELRDAGHVWGQENAETLDMIREELGDKRVRVASIGPAGERKVRYACILNQLGHVNGRTGLGAVMGAKNLKAVAARGDASNFQAADADTLKAIDAWHRERIKTHPPNVGMSKNGTPMHVMALQGGGMLPTRNWQEGVFEGAEKIGLPGYQEIFKRAGTCYRCAVACKRNVEVGEPYNVSTRYGGPEYETLAAFGSLCGIDDLGAVAKANELCNRYGVDTISCGQTVAMVMECCEKGVLGPDKLDGRTVSFGDVAGMLALVEAICTRTGCGELLGEGVKHLAAVLGPEAEEAACHVKGLEPGFHDPRCKPVVGLGFALSPTGADHIECPHEGAFAGEAGKLVAPLGVVKSPIPAALDQDKLQYFKQGQLTWAMNNTLGICNFVVAPLFAMTYDKLVETVQAITGWNVSLWELLRAAERSLTLARLFNVREGFGPQDDKLFARMHKALPAGPAEGRKVDPERFRELIDLYYQMMGWDAEGKPLPGTLVDLGISEVAA